MPGIAYRTYVNLARQTNSGLGSGGHVAQGPRPADARQRQHLPPKNRWLQPGSRPWKQWIPRQRGLSGLGLGQRGLEGPNQWPVSCAIAIHQGTFQGYIIPQRAVSRDFYDGKVRASLRVSDVFDQQEWSYTSEGRDFFQDGTFKRQSRFILCQSDLVFWQARARPTKRGTRAAYGRRFWGSFDGGEF